MIIDFQSNPGHAALYDMIDAATGKSMADQPIFYADDEAGVYRVHLKDAKGLFYINPSNPDEAAWEERRGNFRLVLKAQADEDSGTAERAETWHDLPPLL